MVNIKNFPHNDPNYNKYFESFSFPLSDFQKHAIQSIIDGNHVLVTAHTGSGKTLPAEFAIRHFTNIGKRVIYTAPIKALSNQKYYDFTRKFPDITFGIITGDIKSNPDADVLIMTTEILLNMLTNEKEGEISAAVSAFQIDLKNELAAVIFDEVHYINDVDRGKTWEQTILMLPPHIQLIMLSATIDAPERFAEWVENRYPDHSARVVLTSTDHRVVPLIHYGFLTINEGFIKTHFKNDKAAEKEMRDNTNRFLPLRTATGEFLQENYAKIAKSRNPNFASPPPPRVYVLNTLARKLYEQDMMPAIVFVFSRKMVEKYASEISVNLFQAPLDEFRPPPTDAATDEISIYDDSKIPYIVAHECEQILRSKLPNYREYMELPEYVKLVSLLEKGIAIHHSGMLPVLREIVEFMISKKYVKLLFATESFAIGLDCPIKTTVFTSLEKYDGTTLRTIYPHEYSQMAGRAGRRGRDKIGYVIHCNNMFNLPTATEYKEIMAGKPQTLVSKFHINYSLILKLLETEKPAVNFIEKSMYGGEIADEITASHEQVCILRRQIAEKEKSLEFLRTPTNIVEQYMKLTAEIPRSVNKKRRAMERDLANICEEYRTIKKDAEEFSSYKDLQRQITSIESNIDYLTNIYLPERINIILDILRANELITEENKLTALGRIAARLGEFHPVIFMEFMCETNWCTDYSPEEIIAILSCICDIKVSEDVIRVIPNSDILPSKVCGAMKKLKNLHIKYTEIEKDRGLYTGINYEDSVQFDLADLVYIWALDCHDEKECKNHIQNVCGGEIGISVGDFSKSLLKISNIAREIGVLSEELRPDFSAKLAKIDGLILKYVVTLQSLYI